MTRNWHHKEVPGGIQLGEEWSYCRRVVMINPTCREHYTHSYVLCFGVFDPTRLYVYANSLDDALEECGGWLVEHAPGLIITQDSEEYDEIMTELCGERELKWPPPDDLDKTDSEAYWNAEDEIDGYPTEAGWIPDLGVALEDPTTAELYAYVTGA